MTQRDELKAQLAVLRAEIVEYEALRSGGAAPPSVVLSVVEELPQRLIKARIAAGFTQKQLAQRLGLKEQQVQQYEATEYASASLSRVIKVARVLGAKA